MSNLVDHARRELQLSGVDEDLYGDMTSKAVLELVEVFAKQGHSGMSASLVSHLFNKVVQFQNLTPLTNDPAEWMSTSIQSGYEMYQNRRRPDAFSLDGGKTYYLLEDRRKFGRWFYFRLPRSIRKRIKNHEKLMYNFHTSASKDLGDLTA